MNASQTWTSLVRASCVTLIFASPAICQTGPPPVAREVDLAGPRIGFTALSDGIIEKLDERGILISPFITQFGWQFEKRFYSTGTGLTAVTEWVVLLGGIEQGVILPSVTWLLGLRTANGAEFGIGPNLTPAGTAIAIAAGVTLRSGALNFPINVAVVPSKSGVRVSLLTGFNTRRR